MTSEAQKQNNLNKQNYFALWQSLMGTNVSDAASISAKYLHPDFVWNGPHPINQCSGQECFVNDFWKVFRRSFPDVQHQPDIIFGGMFNDHEWVCSTGYFTGTFAQDWLGIPATDAETFIRYGDFYRVSGGKFVESYTILDIPDVMRQAGFPVLPSARGREGIAPPPQTGDGVMFNNALDPDATQKSLKLVEAMIYDGLMKYDGVNLSSMQMINFWQDDMHWYGPSGIGACYSLKEFEDFHQIPFLKAFPDRRGGNHKARLAEGDYVASTGWPSIRATHSADYLGAPATNQPITMRVMDWWRREGDLLAENWVFIDLIDLFLQFGIDLMERLHEQVSRSKL